jgi:hypothetical protein
MRVLLLTAVSSTVNEFVELLKYWNKLQFAYLFLESQIFSTVYSDKAFGFYSYKLAPYFHYYC